MNKEQLVSEIAKKTGATQKDVAAFVDSYVDVVTKALKAGDAVQLLGFGSIKTKARKATTGRNPRTGEKIDIPAKNVVKFTPAKKLQDAVN